MIVLGIDPGTERTAWVIWDGAQICDHGLEANEDMRARLRRNGIEGWTVACEMIASYGMPVGREVFETCVWIGRFREAIGDRAPWRLVYRREVKLELCGSARAKDANVRQALLDRVGPRGTRANPGPTYGLRKDEWAALGVAIVASKEAP